MTKPILCKDAYVLTMDGELGDLPRADVLIKDGLIAEVGPDLSAGDAEVIDASGKIIAPGLVDGHRHLWLSFLRGASVDSTLFQYMIEARAMYCGCFDAEDAYLANYLGGVESINAGITTVVDHSHLQKSPEVSDALARGLIDSGVAGFYCYSLQNVPDFLDGKPVDKEEVKALLMRGPDDWHQENARRIKNEFFSDDGVLRFGIAMPEGTPYVPADYSSILFAQARAIEPELITGHWDALFKDGAYISSLAELNENGALEGGPKMSFTHGNSLNDSDLGILAKAGVGLCTTPDTECGMGIGLLPTKRFVEMGGAASLGVDLSSYVQADILKQGYLLLQAWRMHMAIESRSLPMQIGWEARKVLELATITGAESIGMGDTIGSITPGKRADLIIVGADSVNGMPKMDPVASLLFYTGPADIDTVIINGEFRKRGGQLVGVDIDELHAKTTAAQERVNERFKQLPMETFMEVWAEMY